MVVVSPLATTSMPAATCHSFDVSSTNRQVWHPCARAPLGGCIVANDLQLGSPATPARTLLLTGPNMGGKST